MRKAFSGANPIRRRVYSATAAAAFYYHTKREKSIKPKLHYFTLLWICCTGWAKKTAHGFHCNNVVCSQSIFIIFWQIYTTGNLQLEDYVVSPPNTVCVITLPCEILITALRMFLHVYYHISIENNNKNIYFRSD